MQSILSLTFSLAVVALFTSPAPLRAEAPIHWTQICQATGVNQLTVTTSDGEIVSGYCVSVQPDKLSIRTADKRVVTVLRTAFSRLQVRTPRGHLLKSLGTGMQSSFHEGAGILFSPLAPVGLAMLPGTVAWGAIAAPFCLFGDLISSLPRERDIKVM